MAKVYLSGADPRALKRTWRDVLNSMIDSKRGGEAGALGANGSAPIYLLPAE